MDVQSDVIPRPVPPPRHKLRKGLVCAKQDEEKSMVSVMWKAMNASIMFHKIELRTFKAK